MCKHELFAIFLQVVFWGGFKTPAIYLFYRDKRRRRWTWLMMIGAFKVSAPFFCFISLMLVLFYIICLPFPIQTRTLAQMVGTRLGKRWELGSNPRPPQIISIILFHMFPCSARSRAHHASQRLGLTSGFKANLKARTCSTRCTLVSKQAHDQKRSTWPLPQWA